MALRYTEQAKEQESLEVIRAPELFGNSPADKQV